MSWEVKVYMSNSDFESKQSYVSGGRNPNWEQCCDAPRCFYLDKGINMDGGWCSCPNNRVKPLKENWKSFTPSVSSTGGCDFHRSLY